MIIYSLHLIQGWWILYNVSKIADKPISKIIENQIIRYTHLLDPPPKMSKAGDFFSQPEWPSIDCDHISTGSLCKDTPQDDSEIDHRIDQSSYKKDGELYKDLKSTTIDHSHYQSESKTQKNHSFSVLSVNDDVHVQFYQDDNEEDNGENIKEVGIKVEFNIEEDNSEDNNDYENKEEENSSMKLQPPSMESIDHNQPELPPLKIEEESWNEGFKQTRKEKEHKYRILSQSQKEFLVKQTQHLTIAYVARVYNVSVNNLCRWKKGCQRKSGAGRKITNTAMEKKLLAWLKSEGRNPQGTITVTRKQIQQKARELANNTDFKASKGWFERFAKRNKQLFEQQVSIVKLQHSTRKRNPFTIIKLR